MLRSVRLVHLVRHALVVEGGAQGVAVVVEVAGHGPFHHRDDGFVANPIAGTAVPTVGGQDARWSVSGRSHSRSRRSVSLGGAQSINSTGRWGRRLKSQRCRRWSAVELDVGRAVRR